MAPIEPIDDMAGQKHEKRRRQELGQADEAEIERAARDVVELPPDCHHLHLRRDLRKQRGNQ